MQMPEHFIAERILGTLLCCGLGGALACILSALQDDVPIALSGITAGVAASVLLSALWLIWTT